MKTIYLCGPINGCTDEECKDWREMVKANWAGHSIDPMRRDYRGKEDECVDEIVERSDISALRSCPLVARPSYDGASWQGMAARIGR